MQAVEQVVALLADLGTQLAEVLPAGSSDAEEVRLRLDRAQLKEVLPAAGGRMLDLPALLALLDWAGHLVTRFGAPARDAAAAASQAAVRRDLATAGGDPAAVTAVAVRGLRLLATQLKLLRLDAGELSSGAACLQRHDACMRMSQSDSQFTIMPSFNSAANVHLRLLARQLGAEGAAAYATSKFEEMLGSVQNCSPDQLGQRLPHTRAWLAAASGQLAHVEQLEAVLASETSTAPVEQVPAPPQMRAGLRASGARSGSTTGPKILLTPCQARTWRGLVRLGLVQLASGAINSWQAGCWNGLSKS